MIKGTGEEIEGNESKVPTSCCIAIRFLMKSKLSGRSYFIYTIGAKMFLRATEKYSLEIFLLYSEQGR